MFMEARVSAYKCTSCIRRSPQTTDIEEVNVVTNVETATFNTSTVNGELLPSEAVLMFTNMLNKLDLLVTEVKCLRADNKSLRAELAFPPGMSAPGTLDHPDLSAPSASNFSGRRGELNQQASVPSEGTPTKQTGRANFISVKTPIQSLPRTGRSPSPALRGRILFVLLISRSCKIHLLLSKRGLLEPVQVCRIIRLVRAICFK
ncbi:hypothetical protein HPB47_001018 [Ixodes persulcatus]|uniref:Uncharacterized protein n=1 Tax=Ixodes persulcatus TaxID=34615 RepID=A0AC60PRN8_IXOPE|nr:hypothetical protein HPB47_001018 [Ixodes persulcatus]